LNSRVVALNKRALRSDGEYVLYWQIMARRTTYNFALERAVSHARELSKPLVVLEPLRIGYRWASDRLHQFCVDGMSDNSAAYAKAGVAYHPYVERVEGEGKGLLEALAKHACVVVTDDYPEFFLPKMLAAAGSALDQVGVRLEAVDSNGLLPVRAVDKPYTYAHQFRRMLQQRLPEILGDFPAKNPLREARGLPSPTSATRKILADVDARWPSVAVARKETEGLIRRVAVDHSVGVVAGRGGSRAAAKILRRYLEMRLPRYIDDRTDLDNPAASELSPYLHWGFVSAHEIFAELAESESWTPLRLSPKPNGKREGWWGMSKPAESFLDELITWRELSFNGSAFLPNHDRYESLPQWALDTLDVHSADRRPAIYSLEQLELGETSDPLWNAAQGQLRADGFIHNYMRMLWGKKIIEWTRHPSEALDVMIHLNNKWAIDGRDPNSYSGIFWVLGRYDRPWPERAVFGKVRVVTSASTARKISVKGYIHRYAGS
jgi:deoxyribodipyrimidine photo-lyase